MVTDAHEGLTLASDRATTLTQTRSDGSSDAGDVSDDTDTLFGPHMSSQSFPDSNVYRSQSQGAAVGTARATSGSYDPRPSQGTKTPPQRIVLHPGGTSAR